MRASLEFLFHYRCEQCQRWWTVADIYPRIGTVTCPHCDHKNELTSVGHQIPEKLHPEQYMNLGNYLITLGETLVSDSVKLAQGATANPDVEAS